MRFRLQNGARLQNGTSKSMEQEGFYAEFQTLSERLGHLQAHHGGVNAGSARKLLEALHQVLAECVPVGLRSEDAKGGARPRAPEAGGNGAAAGAPPPPPRDAVLATLELPDLPVPPGCRRCIGPCGRVLQLNDTHFRRDGKRPKKGGTGFRSRCKQCLSTRKARKRAERPDEADREPALDDEAGGEAQCCRAGA